MNDSLMIRDIERNIEYIEGRIEFNNKLIKMHEDNGNSVESRCIAVTTYRMSDNVFYYNEILKFFKKIRPMSITTDEIEKIRLSDKRKRKI